MTEPGCTIESWVRDAGEAQRCAVVGDAFYAGYQPDVPALHAQLAKLRAPVLLLAGEADPVCTATSIKQATGVFGRATFVVQRGGHYPWLDGPGAFVSIVETFLAGLVRSDQTG